MLKLVQKEDALLTFVSDADMFALWPKTWSAV